MHLIFTFCLLIFALCLSALHHFGHVGDDCKGKQFSESRTVVLAQPSKSQHLVGALWSILAYAG